MTEGFKGDKIIETVLSWFRYLFNGCVSLFTGTEGGSLIRWLSSSWIYLLVFLLIAGIVLNLVIYMIRWRPHWWWFGKKRMVIDDVLLTPRKKKKPSAAIKKQEDLFEVKEDLFRVSKRKKS